MLPNLVSTEYRWSRNSEDHPTHPAVVLIGLCTQIVDRHHLRALSTRYASQASTQRSGGIPGEDPLPVQEASSDPDPVLTLNDQW